MSRFTVVGVLLLWFLAVQDYAQEEAGDWIGQLDSGFKVRVHLEKNASGYSGHLTNPSGNETDFDHVTLQVTSDGTHLHFSVTTLNLSYDARWNDQEKAWKGSLTFQQVYPLILKRAAVADLTPVEHKRPQEAAITAQSRPYIEHDVRFNNPGAHVQLAGTLSVPKGKGPFPAVVLISGTGQNTRDEDVWGHKVFLILSRRAEPGGGNRGSSL